jgi:hypothetical protein
MASVSEFTMNKLRHVRRERTAGILGTKRRKKGAGRGRRRTYAAQELFTVSSEAESAAEAADHYDHQ